MNVLDQVMVIFAGTRGYLDKVPRNQVASWETQFLRYMREQQPEIRQALIKERKLTPQIEQQLRTAIERFQPQFKG